ncbi:MAG: zinc ABC transporter substrate-binding protein [Candidatus Dormibacteraeota bacterium]|nr:zinc ABC transporter substrate-binding protein [Candidatus Dormibacteraeota bacterium]
MAAALAVVVLVAACGGTGSSGATGSKVQVVAAENFWGSIATQIGGDRVQVTSIITNPDTDPHDYDATPKDARLVAQAKFVIVNGAGYDAWASKLLSSNPSQGRQVLDVGDMLGKKEGDNPHFWYSPDYVAQVVAKITDDLKTVDQADASAFDSNRSQFETSGLKAYHDEIGAIKQKYAGTPVGASESIFAYLSPALGLDLVTPPSYMNAISEGTDLSAADKATVDQQVSDRQIKVFVFNSQNSTPDVQEVVNRAKAAGIPVAEITETLAPAKASFQEWQTKQLKALYQALGG